MHTDTMKLWTRQKSNFSLTEGHYDIQQSEYVDDPKFRMAYDQLVSRMETDQYFWCSTVKGGRLQILRSDETMWPLDIPCGEILKFVNEDVWDRITGRGCTLANEKEQPPEGSWWDHLFVKRQANERVSALVRHPIKPEWEVSNPLE